jgi:hypothetical protein
LGQPRTTILKHILNEWLSIHSDDVPDELRVAEAAEIVRQAVSEFILSHHEEFLPKPCMPKKRVTGGAN